MPLTGELSNWLLKTFLGQQLESHVDNLVEMIDAFDEALKQKEEEGLKVYEVGDFTFLTELVGYQRLQFNVDIESYAETLPLEFQRYEGRTKVLGEWCRTIDDLIAALNASEELKNDTGYRRRDLVLWELEVGDDDDMFLVRTKKDYEKWYKRIQRIGGMAATRMTLQAKFYVTSNGEEDDGTCETELEGPEPRTNHYRGFLAAHDSE